MDKEYTTIPANIGSFPRAVYELYFNSVLRRKWVNSSRTTEEMVKEILRIENIPSTIQKATIFKTQNGEISLVWEYIKEGKLIKDNVTGDVYPNFYIAHLSTGILRQNIINQCNQSFSKSRRFQYL